MNNEVLAAVEELKRAFAPSELTVVPDGQGGARVVVEDIDLGEHFEPQRAWMGGHINALYPNADIYPMFMAAEVRRANGKAFEVPITPGATFLDRPALQISRMNNQIHLAPQTAVSKFQKILHFLATLP
jgi:hypothetical protein